jgi:hypothetical protein
MAYDTMARRSELVGFNSEDAEIMPNRSGRMLIRGACGARRNGEGGHGAGTRDVVRCGPAGEYHLSAICSDNALRI